MAKEHVMESPSATPANTSTKTKSKTSAKPAKVANGEKKPVSPRRKKTVAASPAAAADIQIVAEHLRQSAGVEPDAQVLFSMIATAAYYRAEQRSFSPGHDMDDWLEAERQIRASL
jgi:hypothetical protein